MHKVNDIESVAKKIRASHHVCIVDKTKYMTKGIHIKYNTNKMR